MLKLFYMPDTASLAPHIVLRRLGLDHHLIKMSKLDGSLAEVDYQRLNPNKRVPTLVDGDFVVFEAAAICLHLADSNPAAALMPALGSRARAHAYQWLIHLTNSVQADMMLYFYSQRFAKSDSASAEVKAVAVDRVTTLIERIEDTLNDGRATLSGNHKTIVEDYLLMLCRWYIQMGQGETLSKMPKLHTLLQQLEADPVVLETYQVEGNQRLF